MYLETGRPFAGAALSRLKRFLSSCGLDYDEGIDFSVALMEENHIIATGSLDGTTLKCIAVTPEHQGEDLCARLLTELRREAFARGAAQLTLFTKPENQFQFENLGFYPLIRTRDCLLMEDQRNGLARFLNESRCHEFSEKTACIVANADPFTLGHRYLVERAAQDGHGVYLFILSEARGMFSPEVRLEMARASCADLKNVCVRPSGPYMVSSATFPDYFIREKARVESIRCELDVRLFGEKIAPALKIARRFVGEEPLCPVTRRYNEELQSRLPDYSIELVKLRRLEVEGKCVSASRVRDLIQTKNFALVQTLVPKPCYEIICHYARQ